MTSKIIVKYSEKLVENTIKDFPFELLGEQLIFMEQQPKLAGFRPDLLFIDQKQQPVIVEVQIDALDRNHLYRSLGGRF